MPSGVVFTLVELLVVIGIIGILMRLLFSRVQEGSPARRRDYAVGR